MQTVASRDYANKLERSQDRSSSTDVTAESVVADVYGRTGRKISPVNSVATSAWLTKGPHTEQLCASVF